MRCRMPRFLLGRNMQHQGARHMPLKVLRLCQNGAGKIGLANRVSTHSVSNATDQHSVIKRIDEACDSAENEVGKARESRMRTKELNGLLEKSLLADAWSLFNGLLGRKQVDSHQLRLMLATGMRELQCPAEAAAAGGDSWHSNGLHRLYLPFAILIQQGEYTRNVLQRSDEEISRMRTQKLKGLLEKSLHAEAWSLFNGLLGRKQVDSHQLRLMLARACENSNAQRKLLQRAETAGIAMYDNAFNPLLSSLQLEGRLDELAAVVSKMRTRGMEQDKYTQNVLERSDEKISRMRTQKLKGLLEKSLHAEAWSLFNGLL
eukprot:CAMPEP_0119344186 /NCGR_PEP_ID=MMETSP1333-20130426/106840_1 /TAXON_ID=418940 /ORGANISM="Scyphosphaera apsteinii, Strain RCC1455" /LENGTH=317 /DNA_ID=CAMNT_0007356613 /DNA_START=82 /DNA_END=1031 /DNA_ORIENTATION=-